MAGPSEAGAALTARGDSEPAAPAALDAETLADLAAIGCTEEEAAAWLEIPPAALRRALAEPALKEVWARGAACGRVRIRRSQFALAERNASMAGLLGRVMLGQGGDGGGGAGAGRLADIVDTGIDRDRDR